MRNITLALACALLAPSLALAQSGTPPPVPRPFPGSAAPPSTAGGPATPKPTQAATLPAPQPPPAGTVDAYLFPNAEFLDSYDAGRGHQRYYVYGTNVSYAEVVAHYKSVLRGASNREQFRTPPLHQFDLGRFDDETMAYPPSVVVKDYTWNGSPGYLHVAGTAEKRFRTIIQIVPVK
jgi:hypothetical protein